MRFTIDELFNSIICSDLTDEQKTNLITKIYKSNQITNNVFIRLVGENHVFACWQRFTNVDKTTTVGPNGYSIDDIIKEYRSSLKENSIRQ